ncbi:MAG: ATP-binding cassette domain-containing protein [Chitinophagaceae bacterium]
MPVLQVNSVTIKENNKPLIDRLSFSVHNGDQWAIVGPSGSGKTSLLHALAGRHFFTGSITVSRELVSAGKKIVLVEQQHRFKNLSNTAQFYYQQRFNASDAEDAISVEEDLLNSISGNVNASLTDNTAVAETVQLLSLEALLPVRLIQLSNGENKRLQIAKALMQQPAILLMDNPFTGLDSEARQILTGLLTGICRKGIHIILVTSPGEVPFFITHVLTLQKEGSWIAEPVEVFRNNSPDTHHHILSKPDHELMLRLGLPSSSDDFNYAVRMKDVQVLYNNRKILDHISWELRKGERWSLSGPNGAGKSTLLSLINADNPQAYANEIYLFDRRRGTGETIWEIKNKIGFVSPELHLYFDSSINAFEVVASGLFDTIGLFRMLTDTEEGLVNGWMKLLQIENLRNRLLFQLSNSQQRLALLARALVKNPPLLILDEPCQGLDEVQVNFFRSMVNRICMEGNKTLIYVSHYSSDIPDCVTKFLRLENGRIV